MPLYAVENVDDAFDVTRAFLTPVSVGRWLKLALVVFFVGWGSQVPITGVDVSVPFEGPQGPSVPVEGVSEVWNSATLPANVLPILLAVVLGVVVLAVLFGLVGAILEFVLVESRRSGEVTIRRFTRARWRQGLRLFGFRVAVGLAAVLLLVPLGVLGVLVYVTVPLSSVAGLVVLAGLLAVFLTALAAVWALVQVYGFVLGVVLVAAVLVLTYLLGQTIWGITKTALYVYAAEERVPEQFADFDFATLGGRTEKRATPGRVAQPWTHLDD